MFDTQFPWQPAVLVYLTYICAVCTQTSADHLLLLLCTEAGDGVEWLRIDRIRDAFTASVNRANKLCQQWLEFPTGPAGFLCLFLSFASPARFFCNTIFKFDFLMPLIALFYNRIHKHIC